MLPAAIKDVTKKLFGNKRHKDKMNNVPSQSCKHTIGTSVQNKTPICVTPKTMEDYLVGHFLEEGTRQTLLNRLGKKTCG